LSAVQPERAVGVAIAEREHKAILADHPRHRRAGIPLADRIAHADTELIGVRGLQVVLQHIDFGARTEQDPCYPHGVLGTFLTKVLDPIGRHIMKKRCSMRARRALSNQSRIFTKQPLERRHVAVNDRVRGQFEL